MKESVTGKNMKENRVCPIHSADQADSVLYFYKSASFNISNFSFVVCFCYFSLTRFSLGLQIVMDYSASVFRSRNLRLSLRFMVRSSFFRI